MITEDGTGLSGANSYASAAVALTFHTDRANAAWIEADTAAQAAALVRATDYVEANYTALELPLTSTQGLQFPTVSGLPGAVVRATILLGLEALSGPLSPKLDQDVMQSEENLEGLGGTKTVYSARPCDPYPHITALLRPFASSRFGGVVAGRVLR